MSPIQAPRVVAAHTHKVKAPSPPKTLTPKRKHRKMLKDGTSEVWPEDVETIFVEGLRQYWQSPWATFSSGRSRWRNAYLVEYLQKAGIYRTKKQVASHIQVLRNMWKGEPEYALVAGADDENTKSKSTSDDDDSDAGSGSASSPITPNSPFEDAFTSAHAPAYSAQHKPTGASTLRIVTTTSPVSVKTEDIVPDVMFSPFSSGGSASYAVPRSFPSAPVAPSPLSSNPGVLLGPDLSFAASYPPISPEPQDAVYPFVGHMQQPQSIPRHRSSSASSSALHASSSINGPRSHLSGFTVWSDRESICALAPGALGDSVRAALRVSLQVPGPMNIVPAVSVSAPWAQASCTTTVAVNNQVVSHDRVSIPPPTAMTPGAPLMACLPDPLLPYGRWLDYGTLTVAQKLTVDNFTVVLVEFTIARSDAGLSGHVFDFRGCAADGSPRWSPVSMSSLPLPSMADPHATPVAPGSHAGTSAPAPPVPRVACAPTPTAPCGYQMPGAPAFGPYR